ncbi:hypothetical protein SK128_014851, partial [Halocaridina rubra]
RAIIKYRMIYLIGKTFSTRSRIKDEGREDSLLQQQQQTSLVYEGRVRSGLWTTRLEKNEPKS